MNRFFLPQHRISSAFWETVALEREPQLNFYEARGEMAAKQNLCYLFQFCRRMNVKTVIEFGSGQSTHIMRDAGVGRIDTCCRNAFTPDPKNGSFCEIRTHQGESTEMLKTLTGPVDLFFIDARLHAEDFDHIERLSRPDSWYLLDDFYGLDKGVINALWLPRGRYLLTPLDGAHGISTLAALAPLAALELGGYYEFQRRSKIPSLDHYGL